MGKMFDALQKMEREKTPELREAVPKTAPRDIVFDSRIITYFEPYSLAAEQFRRLKTHIIRTGMENSRRTILVTSAMAEEGKTLNAVNLALCLAEDYQSHVLLVDCDLRNPSFSKWFGFEEKRGISDYLAGEAELPDLILKTPLERLSILPCGSMQENPVELIGSNRMKDLVQELKTRYADRYVIFDSSPLLATTEPTVLNEMVDGILFVIKSGTTPRESVSHALKMLDREKIMGVVLNDLQFKTQGLIRRYFGHKRYYGDYRYTSERSEPRGIKSFFKRRGSGKKDISA